MEMRSGRDRMGVGGPRDVGSPYATTRSVASGPHSRGAGSERHRARAPYPAQHQAECHERAMGFQAHADSRRMRINSHRETHSPGCSTARGSRGGWRSGGTFTEGGPPRHGATSLYPPPRITAFHRRVVDSQPHVDSRGMLTHASREEKPPPCSTDGAVIGRRGGGNKAS